MQTIHEHYVIIYKYFVTDIINININIINNNNLLSLMGT